MVSGLRASDTAGTSVSQCADTATIAWGLGRSWPSDARKARAGTSSRIRVGEPCETKIVGMDIALFLVAPVAACVQLGMGDHHMHGKAEIMKVLRTALQALAWLALLAAAPAGAQTLQMGAPSDPTRGERHHAHGHHTS